MTDSISKANLLNRFFHSTFSPSLAEPPVTRTTPLFSNHITEVQLTVSEVVQVLRSLDVNKASGPDAIPNKILINVADNIAPSLCRLFNLSLSLGEVPANWKLANIAAVFKKDDPTLPCNYRPISLLNTLSKVLERCVFNHCYQHLGPIITHIQHGFLKNRSTITQLLEVYHYILDSVAGGTEVDTIYLDLTKAFDTVPHNLMLMKLENYGVNGSLLAWFTSYLSGRQQRVVVDGFYSDWLPVTSGVPQGSILGPLLFLVYVNDAPDYIQQNSSIALYADDSKLFRSIKQQTDYTFLQSDLDSLYHWSQDWAMSFSSTKCEVMHFSRKRKPCSHLDRTYSLAGQQLRSVPSIKDLGVTIASDLSWSKHIENITCNANRTLGLVKRVCRDIDDISTRKLLYCSIIIDPSLNMLVIYGVHI